MTLDISIERDGEGRTVDAAPLEALVAEALAAEGIEDGAVSLLLAGDELLWRFNREYRGVDAPTDMLVCSPLVSRCRPCWASRSAWRRASCWLRPRGKTSASERLASGWHRGLVVAVASCQVC